MPEAGRAEDDELASDNWAALVTASACGTPIDTSDVVRWDRIWATWRVPRIARPRLAE